MDNLEVICVACLSRNRSLVPVTKLVNILQETQLCELENVEGGLCWECRTIIKKFHKFRIQCREAQMTISEVDQPVKFHCLSTLVSASKNTYDEEFVHPLDPLLEDVVLKQEIEQVKDEFRTILEDSFENFQDNASIGDEIDQSDVTIDSTKSKRCKKKLHKSKIIDIERLDEINRSGHGGSITNFEDDVMGKDVLDIIKNDYCNHEIDVTVDSNKSKHKKKLSNAKSKKDNSQKLDDINNSEQKVQRRNICVDLKSKRYVEKLSRVKKPKKKTGEELKKFEEVVFTEEEMVRSREEKRNQPNFKKIPYKCETCVLGFMRKENLELHLEKKHDKSIGDHACPVCDIRFLNSNSVERHRRKHYVYYRCLICKYESGELWSAVNHCKVKHRDDTADQIHCEQCRVVVRNQEDLAEHIKAEHTLYCEECGEKFKGKNTLRSHKTRIHAIKREFRCDFCKKSFVTKTRLESHMVTHNAAIAKKLAYCAVCNVQYKNIYVYRNHLKTSANHSEVAYPCPQCNKRFASKVYRSRHYNFYHLHRSNYHCEICNKFFISDWKLKNHRQKHHGHTRSRDHPCNVCGKKFYTLSTLRGHKLTHSEQRSYMCEDCGDTFKQRAALYTHSKLVHKEGKKCK